MKKNYLKRTMKRITKTGIVCLLSLGMMGALAGCGDDYSEYDEEYEDVEDFGESFSEDELEDSGNESSEETSENEKSDSAKSDSDSSEKSSSKKRRLLTVDRKSGNMTISRPGQDNSIAAASDGKWTIFVYVCGSDLESDNGAATADIEEMLSAKASDNVRFVVETGGASEWQNDVDASSLQRYVIENGKMELADEASISNMGDASVLSDFLSWGVQNYNSEKMGVVFWNHGGGSISGVCFDERYDSDSLDLKEIDSALLSVYSSMSIKFEFVGFDACLMGTIETANILASYSNYMYGSEEMEPGSGWDYTAIGNFLADNPGADGVELGKTVSDSFLKSCEEVKDDDIATMSVIDLSKVDDIVTSFNTFAENLYNATADANVLSECTRNIEAVDNYGGNNRSEGYTNMVDMGGLISACSSKVEGGDAVISAINSAVIYKISGKTHKSATGLSTYYPLCVQGSSELTTFGSVCVSPYYISFVDRQNNSAVNGGSTENYDEDYWWSSGDSCGWYENESTDDESFDDLLDYLFSDDTDEGSYDDSEDETPDEDSEEGNSEDDYSILEDFWCWLSEDIGDETESGGEETGDTSSENSENVNDHWSYVDNYEITGESPLIKFEKEPGFDQDGYYCFKLASDSIDNASGVFAYIYEISENNDLIEIGETYDVNGSWDTGEFSDGFDGYWLSLPDGQNLATYIVYDSGDDIVYTSPVLLNGEETNLRLIQDSDGNVTIEGAWDGIDENGASSREITKLKDGDVIVPIYNYIKSGEEDYAEDYYQGDEFKVSGNVEINYGPLYVGDYGYSFGIDDIYGDYYMTDSVVFNIDEDGNITFEE